MKQMERAAALIGRGWRDEDVCQKLGCSQRELEEWRGQKAFVQKCDAAYRTEVRRLHYRTVDVLGRQLEGDEGRLAQSAASALAKLASDMEQDEREINVYFDRMPEPGTPERGADER